MMDNRIGMEIRNLRKKLGMSQENISSSVVSQSAISKIENGKYVPNLHVLEAIASKLGVPVDHFLTLTTCYNSEYIETTYEMIEQLSLNEEYEELNRLTAQLIDCGEAVEFPNWFKDYIRIHHLFSEFQCKKKDAKTTLKKLKCMAGCLPFEQSIQTKFHLYLGIIHSHMKKYSYSETLDYLQKSLASVEGIKGKNTYLHKKNLKIYILYQKAIIELNYHHYDAALKDIGQGLQLSRNYACTAYVGQFLYYKGLCLEKKGVPFKNILKHYEEAHFFASFTNNLPFKKLLSDKLSVRKEESYGFYN
ncbi:helix-turn-helix domain-containing protein [Shouchella clausii]|uniref:helix-turn-helix domain-containing protein n=1 Tax=Shouchella clausii TaxID=79880 RepID=UPI000D8DC273|nr:helix-turn-helix domain-containing protein [Shouchella clausii]MEB5478494.1 helix-turn-helix domain-containing protein [Shouchella clausii]SPT78494.1 transcriptional regulator [Niallia circulans]